MAEPDLRWIKSSHSNGVGACVELAAAGDRIAVRHSKNPEALLHYTRAEFAAFLRGAKDGEFDHLLDSDPA